MNSTRKYTMSWGKKAILVLLLVVTILTGWHIGTSNCRASEEKLITCWAMCKPGNYVVARRSPQKNALAVGYLDPCDPFETDGVTKNGFVHAIGLGETGESWIYAGFIVTEKPEPVFERYYCSSIARVACRRWVSGPQISGKRGWIYNGDTLEVFYRTETWSVTSRGYVKSTYLECDPE